VSPVRIGGTGIAQTNGTTPGFHNDFTGFMLRLL
jgi:hypothetical protein